jgi:transcriptional regulator with XRE-family HTH domain
MAALRVTAETRVTMMSLNVNKKKRLIRYRGVNALARYLGVTPAHVSQVLSGKRESRRVSAAALGRIQSEEIEMVR